METLAKYLHPWRTSNDVISDLELKFIVSDHFADHNVGGIAVWVTGPAGIPVLKTFVGLKKYIIDPSSPSLTLVGHHYGYLGDVEDGNGEIFKFD